MWLCFTKPTFQSEREHKLFSHYEIFNLNVIQVYIVSEDGSFIWKYNQSISIMQTLNTSVGLQCSSDFGLYFLAGFGALKEI